VKQFKAFKNEHQVDQKIATTLDSPVNKVTWYDAAAYCNWLSRRDGIPESQYCYEPNKEGLLEFVPDYRQRQGYRLPTDDEWEFACRAGARTEWYFGEADEELVGNYAWWVRNSHGDVNSDIRSFPVGLLKPNDWGLFDMHGNASELCQESARPQQGIFANDVVTVSRGGSYRSNYRGLACDSGWAVTGRKMFLSGTGFRPVRSLP
jgi:formylglycine-generating enzyme required for sulfatase activity